MYSNWKTTSADAIISAASINDMWRSNMSWFWASAMRIYWNYFMYNMDEYMKLKKDNETRRSCLKSPVTHTIMNTSFNMLLESNTTMNIYRKARKNESEEERKIDEDFLNEVVDLAIPYMESKSWYIDNMQSAWFDAMLLGFSHCSVWWWENHLQRKDWKNEINKKEWFPMWEYNSPFDNFYYGTNTIQSDNKIFIKRRIHSNSWIKKYMELLQFPITKEIEEKLKEGNFYVSSFDYESLKTQMAYYSYSNLNVSWDLINSDSLLYGWTRNWADILSDHSYDLKGEKNRSELLYVSDNTGTDVWLWDVLLWHTKRPFPINDVDNVTIKFKKIPWSNMWLGLWFVAQPIQKAFDSIINPRIDTTILQASPFFLQRAGSGLFTKTPIMKATPWAIYTVSDPVWAIIQWPVPVMWPGPREETEALFSMVQWSTGVNSMSMGMQQKVERVSGAVNLLKASIDNAQSPIMQSIEEARGKMLKRALIYMKVKYSDADVNEIFGEDSAFSKIKLKDLVYDYSFSFTMRNEQLESKTSDVNVLIELMKTNTNMWQNWVTTWISSEKIAKVILEKMNTHYWDLSAESVNAASQNIGLLKDAVQGAQDTWPSFEQNILRQTRAAQMKWAWDVPPEMTSNAMWVNTSQ